MVPSPSSISKSYIECHLVLVISLCKLTRHTKSLSKLIHCIKNLLDLQLVLGSCHWLSVIFLLNCLRNKVSCRFKLFILKLLSVQQILFHYFWSCWLDPSFKFGGAQWWKRRISERLIADLKKTRYFCWVFFNCTNYRPNIRHQRNDIPKDIYNTRAHEKTIGTFESKRVKLQDCQLIYNQNKLQTIIFWSNSITSVI